MDGKVQVEVLRKHSEHVGKLVTQLTGKLTHLAHVLSAPQSPPDAETAGLCAACAESDTPGSALTITHIFGVCVNGSKG